MADTNVLNINDLRSKPSKQPDNFVKERAFKLGRRAKTRGFARISTFVNEHLERYFLAGFDGLEFPKE